MPEIVDQFGRTARHVTTGSPLYEDTQSKGLRLSRANYARDFSSMQGGNTYRAQLSDARYIYAAFDIVSGAVKQKSQYVSANGWMPKFLGGDKDWEAVALPVFKRSLQTATNKGWSFQKLWKLGCRTLDRDGGFFILRYNNARGFPLTQVLEAHRVGNRDYGNKVIGGKYDGAVVLNGIIYSDDGAEIAYNVLGSDKESDRQISTAHMTHVADFDFFSENRPFPKIAYAVMDLYDIKETRGFQKIGQKARSAISLVETNSTGQNINDLPGTTSTTAGGMSVETFEAGMIRYIKSGGKLDTVDSDQPGGSWLDFDQVIVNGAMYGMGWRAEMSDLSRLKGAGVRGFADNINASIGETHSDLVAFAYADAMARMAVLIERGDIPEHPEWDRWGFPSPRRFDPDPGKTSGAEIDNVRAGRMSIPQLIHLDGSEEEDVLISQAKYLKLKREIAEKYEVNEHELGTLSLPGDMSTGGAVAAETSESGELVAEQTVFENLKSGLDAYGVGVRAGAITPQSADEDSFRAKANWPPTGSEAKRQWKDDAGVRRPITLLVKGESGGPPQASPLQSAEDE